MIRLGLALLFTHLDDALALVAPGGFYIVDDLLPQPTWPEGHAAKAEGLIDTLTSHLDFHVAQLDWSSGIIIATKTSPPGGSTVAVDSFARS